MSGPVVILLLGWLNVGLWATVAYRSRHYHPHHLVKGVRTGVIVAAGAGALGGAVTAFGFLGSIPIEVTQLVGAAWRTMMAVGLLYAIWASVLAARATRR